MGSIRDPAPTIDYSTYMVLSIFPPSVLASSFETTQVQAHLLPSLVIAQCTLVEQSPTSQVFKLKKGVYGKTDSASASASSFFSFDLPQISSAPVYFVFKGLQWNQCLSFTGSFEFCESLSVLYMFLHKISILNSMPRRQFSVNTAILVHN